MMHYSTPSPTAYGSLNPAPFPNALPGGVPRGPWADVARAAPGAQIPSVRYPGMINGGLGAPVSFVNGSLGAAGINILGNGPITASKAVTGLLVAGALSALYGAGVAYYVGSANPVRNTAAFAGGVTVGTGLLALLVAKSNGTA